MTDWIVRHVAQHRISLVLACLFCLLASGLGIKNLTFSVDYHAFFSEDNPEMLAYEEMTNNFTNTDSLFFVVTPKQGTVFSPDALKAIRDITAQAWTLPHAIRVDSVSNFQHTVAQGDDLFVDALIPDDAEIDSRLSDYAMRVALSEPLLLGRLVNAQANVTAVNVTFQLPGISLSEVPDIAEAARSLAEEVIVAYPGIEVRLSGIIMLNNAYGEAARKDIKTLIPVMLLVIYLVLSLLLRSLPWTLACVSITVMSVVSAMGIAGWMGITLTTVSVVAPTIIMTIVVGNCVHVLVSLQQHLRAGNGRHEALSSALRANILPIFLTSLTTAVAFLAMNSSEVPPFNDLGNIVAAGVAAAFLYSVGLLPPLLSVLPVPRRDRLDTRFPNAMHGLASFVIGNDKTILVVVGAIAATLIWFVPQNQTNEKYVEQFSPRMEFRQHADYLIENLTGYYRIDIALETGTQNGIADPAFLNDAADFVDWLRTLPDVQHVASVTDTFRRLNQNLHGDDPSQYVLPNSRDLASQYLLLYEMSLPFGLDLNNLVDLDKSAIRLIVIFDNVSTTHLLSLDEEINRKWRENAQSAAIATASTMLMFSHITSRAVESMLSGTLLVLGVISLMLTFMLRSLRVGMISLLPNLFPVLLSLGIWGIFVGEVGMSMSIVMAMTLGIVVDDTVHFLSKYLHARKTIDLSQAESIRYAFKTVGHAMVVTSGVLICGFTVLSLSMFARNADMGLLTSITILMALLIDFLLLPPLLMRFDRKRATNSALAVDATRG